MKKSNVILFVFSVTIAFVSQVLAADFHVSTRNQLKEALSMSAGNKDAKDTIYLAAGIYTGEYRLDGFRIIEGEENELKVCGEDGTTAEEVILDGENISNIIDIDSNNSNVTIKFQGLKIYRGGGDTRLGQAACIQTDGNIEFIKCIIDQTSGGFYGTDVLYLRSKKNIIISNSTISNSPTINLHNDVEHIKLYANTVILKENTFVNNRGLSTVSIYNAYSITINSNQITYNEGGIRCSNIEHLYISNNVVSRNNPGGGIYISGIKDCIISHNTLTSNFAEIGGAIILLLQINNHRHIQGMLIKILRKAQTWHHRFPHIITRAIFISRIN
jgi:hypothetical protein